MKTRNAERRTRNSTSKFARLFRVSRSNFRVLLAAALTACGQSAGPEVTVTIPAGSTLDAAVDSLAANRVIDRPGPFRLYARLRGLGSSLKSGVYLFRQHDDWGDVVAALKRGRGLEVRWTVREGLMLVEVADLAQAQFGIPRDSFIAATKDPALLAGLGLQTGGADGTARGIGGGGEEPTSAEGYLFPTTYVVARAIGSRELVRVMTREFTAQWQPEWQARLDSLRLSRHQLVTLASIIEAEVRYDPDRPFVSAVYHNRLARGMKLDADPTVSYAYGRRLKRVWEKNLAVRSPYNTYRNPGLPPGPIGQPGRASLEAALYPANVPFFYFVAQPDGKHIFSTTYSEHLAAIRAIRRPRRPQQGSEGNGPGIHRNKP